MTRQRAAVYEYLYKAEQHPTAEEVYRWIKSTLHSISLATVYKVLEALVDCGLASKLVAANGSARDDVRRDPHDHLRCLRSRMVEDLSTSFDPDLISKLGPKLARKGFRLTGYRPKLVGFNEDGHSSGARYEGKS